MFGFLKKKALPDTFFQGACDVHSHILPHVDDGFKSEEASIEALRYLEKIGVGKVRLTPHFMKEYGDNTKETMIPKFDDFKKKAEVVCGIELYLGAEHMLDDNFQEHFEKGFLTIDNEGCLVLCETSYMMCSPNMNSMLYEIMLEGYTPVIAHPERYQYASLQQFEIWKEKGYLFQLNLLSLSGAYGKSALEKSLFMLRNGKYDFVGFDMHRLDSFCKYLSKLELTNKEIDALHLLYENNSKLF